VPPEEDPRTRVDRFGIAQVEGCKLEGRAPLLASDVGHGVLGAGLAPAGEDDVHRVRRRGELERGLAADASVGARHDHDAPSGSWHGSPHWHGAVRTTDSSCGVLPSFVFYTQRCE
jgi:hypothetical protein